MTCHVMGQRLFWGQMRLGLLLNSTDATTYWQKRAGILDKRQDVFVPLQSLLWEYRIHQQRCTPPTAQEQRVSPVGIVGHHSQ